MNKKKIAKWTVGLATFSILVKKVFDLSNENSALKGELEGYQRANETLVRNLNNSNYQLGKAISKRG